MPRLPKRTSLNAAQQYELNQWLQENNINPAKLRRPFADVVPVARLLSRYYPELVDINIYPPRNSVQSKLSNWDLFSQRVLYRLGLRVSREEMDRVARCVPGAIDLLLYDILTAHQANQYIRRQAEKDSDSSQNDDDYNNWDEGKKRHDIQRHAKELAETASILETGGSASLGPIESASVPPIESGASNVKPRKAAAATGGLEKQRATWMLARKKRMVEGKDIVVVNMRKLIGDLMCELPQKMVPYSVYEQTANNLEQKSIKIARYLQRNAHLESMLQLKAEHIEELQQRVNLLQIQSRRSKGPSAQSLSMSQAKQRAVSSSTSFTSIQASSDGY